MFGRKKDDLDCSSSSNFFYATYILCCLAQDEKLVLVDGQRYNTGGCANDIKTTLIAILVQPSSMRHILSCLAQDEKLVLVDGQRGSVVFHFLQAHRQITEKSISHKVVFTRCVTHSFMSSK
jgi:hypothetical protein